MPGSLRFIVFGFRQALYSAFDLATVSFKCSSRFAWIRPRALSLRNAGAPSVWNYATTCWRAAPPRVPAVSRSPGRGLKIGLHILIRPRGGDFLYNEDEMAIMREDVRIAKDSWGRTGS